MRGLWIGMGVLALATSGATSAAARAKYEPYVARDTIGVGNGGTLTNKNCIDFWTMGAPPRRYQILGVITDTRGTGWIAGDAVGSKKITNLVRKVGGDAVVLLTSDSKITGIVSGGQSRTYGNADSGYHTYGGGWSAPVRTKYVSFAVLKYLPDAPAPKAP